MVAGLTLPLDEAVKQYDELPAVGDVIEVNGDCHVVQKRTITEPIERPEPKLVIKLARCTEEVVIHSEVSSEDEIREQAQHLLE